MKILSKLTLGLALMLGLGIGSTFAQSATAPATMEIQTALDIQLDGTLDAIDFGTVSATTPGVVFLDPKGSANVNTGAQTNVALFNVTGSAGAAVVFTFDPTVTLTNGTPAQDITMTSKVIGADVVGNRASAADLTSTAVNLQSTSGTYFVWVGGELPQLANQTTGTYTGTFNIAVAYN
jgi:hypothetical protein